jgi:hypothetical protein
MHKSVFFFICDPPPPHSSPGKAQTWKQCCTLGTSLDYWVSGHCVIHNCQHPLGPGHTEETGNRVTAAISESYHQTELNMGN